MPVRIYDIAKKLGLESKEVLAKAKELKIAAAKVPSSALDLISAEWLEEEIIKSNPAVAAKLAPLKKDTIKLESPQPAVRFPRIVLESSAHISAVSVQSIRRLVIPLRNRDENFLEVGPWLLANNVRVSQITDEDFATFHREETEILKPIVTVKSQCLVIDLLKDDIINQVVNETAAKIQFVFKTFSSNPLVLSHAAVVTTVKDKKATVEKTLALPVWGDYGQFLSQPFTFMGDASIEKVTQFYNVLTTAMSKHPGLLITLSRFNSCWLRSTDHDRVIDVAVSLESLLSSVTEIKFKFALFNSFITHSLPVERERTFELLQLLYDVRSIIVHGDTNKSKISKLSESIDEIFRIAQAAITYYVFFLNTCDPKNWQKHIEKLVFGTEKRINQEDTANENQKIGQT